MIEGTAERAWRHVRVFFNGADFFLKTARRRGRGRGWEGCGGGGDVTVETKGKRASWKEVNYHGKLRSGPFVRKIDSFFYLSGRAFQDQKNETLISKRASTCWHGQLNRGSVLLYVLTHFHKGRHHSIQERIQAPVSVLGQFAISNGTRQCDG